MMMFASPLFTTFVLVSALSIAPSFAQTFSSDQVASSLGLIMGMASLCAKPTAPLEAELESYIKKVGAGPLEAGRLRGVMLQGSADYRRLMTGSSFLHCETADHAIMNTIARVRAATTTLK